MRRPRLAPVAVLAALGVSAAPATATSCWNAQCIADPFVREAAHRSDTTSPTTPDGVAARGVSRDAIELRWNASTDTGPMLNPTGEPSSIGYRVQRRTSGSEFVTIAEVWPYGDPSYTDSAVARRTTYTYRVVARDHAGNESDPSTTADAEAR